MIVNELSGEVELVCRRVLRYTSRAFGFLVVRANPVDPILSSPVFINEFDPAVNDEEVSHRA